MDLFDPKENLIAMLGLENAPEELRFKVLKRAADMVMKRVVLRLMEKLPPADVAAANALADRPEELIAFLSGKVEDVDALMREEAQKVKNEMVSRSAPSEN
jgi:hypothetical protein